MLVSLPRHVLPLLLAACGLAAQAQPVMQPGAWQFTERLTHQLPGKPPSHTDSRTVTQCLTVDFLAAEPYFTPGASASASQPAQCHAEDYQRLGSAARWRLACRAANGGLIDVRVHNQASAQALTLRSQQTVTHPSGAQEHIGREIQARRLGECRSE